MSHSFFDYFRCPDSTVRFSLTGELSKESGYFRFGKGITCYGRTASSKSCPNYSSNLWDSIPAIKTGFREVGLPFDLDEIATNLRCELYAGYASENETRLPPHPFIRNLYYLGRPLMPVRFRKILQRIRLKKGPQNPFPRWPVDRTVDQLFESAMSLAIRSRENEPVPFIWFWPEGATAALILTHDVETESGRDFCSALMDLDDEFGFKSSFQVIPERRYEVSGHFLETIRGRGFEVNVHDLNHDGNLFRAHDEFLRRADKINKYVEQFRSAGFRSGALYRNLCWYDAFRFSYDMSVPNVGHLDPQGGGCCTLFPYAVGAVLEIPVTATQDYSLFHILNTYSLDLWKEQCQLILNGHGLVSIIVHPDYVIGEKPRETYRQLLQYLTGLCAANKIWSTLPREIDRWWRSRLAMKLVRHGNTWRIEGEGKERARIAYAHLVDGNLSYSFDPVHAEEGILVTEKFVPSIEAPSTPLSNSETDMAYASGLAGTGTQLKQSTIDTSSGKNKVVAKESASLRMPVLELEKPSTSSPTRLSPPTHSARKRLRVCMVTYSFYENDNRVMRYAETLALRGDEVDVFALQRDERPREEILNGVRLHRLQSRKINEKSRFSYLGRILQFLFRSMYQVSRNHLRQKYDLLHIHSVPDFMVFAGSLPRMTGTPVILDIHDILPEFYTSKFASSGKSISFQLLQKVEQISAKFSSHVIIANHIWQERLLSRSVEPGKCTVVLNSPDRSIFNTNGAHRAANKRFVMLYPGTLNWHQGLDLAIRAFGRVRDQVPEADFHIYGDGPTKEDLQALIRGLGLENRVFIRIPLPLREVAKVIASADLGIVPKRKDTFGNEAFSTKILEFMAVGVPVIVSDTQVDRYYFDDSVVRFFRGGEEEDLARSIVELIRNPQQRETMVRNATKFVGQMDWTAKRHEYLELVDRLASSAKGSR
jgi:glycosyltransferase involved in cell wall biosynthesis